MDRVRWIAGCVVALVASGSVALTQGPASPRSPFLAPPDQVVAIRAGRMFESNSGTMRTNQIILIRGARIADVGPSVQIPAGARVIDLSGATVLPGMIDAHVHNSARELSAEMRTILMVQSALRDLEAGFTTTVDMDSRGGFGTLELRDAINAGIIKGPRMQVSGQSLNQRASAPYPNPGPGFYSGYTEDKNVNGPWLGRAAVRESKLHGVDWIKIYTTQDFVGAGELHEFKPDGSLLAFPSLTFEEVQAIVDEAHRLGLKVACHTYGGEGMRSCINAGVDLNMHVTELYRDDALFNTVVERRIPIMVTLDDLLGLDRGDRQLLRNLNLPEGAPTRLGMAELTFRRLLKANVPFVFGSGAVAGDGAFPHGKQADQFGWMVKWGMTPAQALQTAFMNAAGALNYGWADRVGSLERGKFADVIAVRGDPLSDVTIMERVEFVMKGGVVVRDH